MATQPNLHIENLPQKVGESFTLPTTLHHHWVQVLRAKAGAVCTLFDGQGRVAEAYLTDVSKKQAVVTLTSLRNSPPPKPPHIHLRQCLIKPQKMDWLLQKAVELGVRAFTPLISDHCAVKCAGIQADKRHPHWQAVLTAACEQSGQYHRPDLHRISPLSRYLSTPPSPSALTLILTPPREPETTPILTDQVSKSITHIDLLVGPEGGFSDTEYTAAINKGFIPWQLGIQTLRAETAAIAAISCSQLKWGAFRT